MLRPRRSSILLAVACSVAAACWGRGPVPIRSIDPGATDTADLAPLSAALGDARVVLLATPGWSDGAATLAMTRLTLHLVRTRGFDVVLLPTGLWDGKLLDEALAGGLDWQVAAQLGLPRDLAINGQLGPLLEHIWLSHLDGPGVRVGGYDMVQNSPRTLRTWPREALDVLAEIDPHPMDRDARVSFLTVLERIEAAFDADDDDALASIWDELTTFSGLLEHHAPALARTLGPTATQLWRRSVDNVLLAFEHRLAARDLDEVLETLVPEHADRRRRMGELIAWHATEHHPRSRIVVWTLARHALARPGDARVLPDDTPMPGPTPGSVARAALGPDAIWSCAVFTPGDRVEQAIRPGRRVRMGPDRSLDAELDATQRRFVFQSLAGATGRRQSRLAGLDLVVAPGVTAEAAWGEQLDAVLWIGETFDASPRFGVPDGFQATLGAGWDEPIPASASRAPPAPQTPGQSPAQPPAQPPSQTPSQTPSQAPSP